MSDKKLFLFILLAIGLLLASAVVAHINTRHLHEDTATVAHTHKVLSILDNLQNLTSRAEAVQRGFLLSGSDEYRQQFRLLGSSFERELTTLRDATGDNERQQKRIPVLRAQISGALHGLAEAMSQGDTEGLEAARMHWVAAPERSEMDDVRTTIRQMSGDEHLLLIQRSQAAQRSYWATIGTRVVSLTLLLSVLFTFIYQLRRNLAFRSAAAREIHEQREKLQVTLASIAEAVITADLEGKLTYLNQVAQQLTGWQPAAAQRQPLERVFHVIDPRTSSQVRDIASKVLHADTSEGLPRDATLVSLDGGQKPIQVEAAPIRNEDGSIAGSVIVFRDASAQLQLERELKEAARRKDEFLAMLAHELRNPLAPISYAVQTLQKCSEDKASQPELSDAVGIIARQVRQLIRLIDDLLDVSRITSGKLVLRRQEIALADVLTSAVEISRPLVDAAGLELEVRLPDEPVWLDADEIRLAQVFSNLLNNAAKYTRRPGHIWLTASATREEAVIRVRDNGQGIDQGTLPHIFELFVQSGDPSYQLPRGLGVGLALVERLVGLHGGRVEARSPGLDQGSEFVVRLPRISGPRPPQPSSPRDETQATLTGRGSRILVVEDHEPTAAALAMLLRISGNEVSIAASGSDAFGIAEAIRPDVVLLDIGLPKLSGYDVARRIRSEPWGRNMVLIALSGWGHETDRARAKEAGFDRHLVKPLEFANLQRVLAAHLARRN